MSCRFCFAQFKNVTELQKTDAITVVRMIADNDFRKINFVGGEPTLVPWLKDAMIVARNGGLITSIITNGWNIDRGWLEEYAGYLDWIGISIDSLYPKINSELGRIVPGLKTPSFSSYLDSLNLVREYDIKLKINTVVNQLNKDESFHNLIKEIQPEKWKIFQVLIIENENLGAIDLSVTIDEFNEFLVRHSDLNSVTGIFPEYCEDMKASYLIINPAGRFVDNSAGKYHYSDCILDIGVENALRQVNISLEKFTTRQDPNRMKNIITDVIG